MAAADGTGVSGANGGEMGAAQGSGAQGQRDASGISAAAAGRSASEQPQLPQVRIYVEWSCSVWGRYRYVGCSSTAEDRKRRLHR
jgi:hypothetical protein